MNSNVEKADYNLFKLRRPGRGVFCPKHKKRICIKYIQPEPPASFKPSQEYRLPDKALETDTVYQLSYQPVNLEELAAARQVQRGLRSNLQPLDGPVQNETITSLSYAYTWQPPPQPSRPKSGIEKNSGNMQDRTTHMHDYMPMPFTRCRPYVPNQSLNPPDAKMDDRTVTRESFQPVGDPVPVKSFKPSAVYRIPELKMDGDSITKLSFPTPEMPPREQLPWMKRASFSPPELPMCGDTIYNGSYLPPGEFEPCDSDSLSNASSCGEPCLCNVRRATDDL